MSLPKSVLAALARTNASVAVAYPGETTDRQPVHTVYGGAHLFTADSVGKIGAVALSMLDEYGPDGRALPGIMSAEHADNLPLAPPIRARVVEKLKREPVEDLRIDFED